LAALAVVMMHLSRFCEDLIIWSTDEFGFVEIDDAYSTGSSMMPQKKNPDSLELVRGKTGRVYGNLTALLTTMKGLALTYSKDMQEDKEPVFDSFETVQDCLEVFTKVWGTMTVHGDRMRAAIDDGTLATDLADYLVKRGLPFRDAHGVVAALVKTAMDKGGALSSLTAEDLQSQCELFGPEALELLDVDHSIDLRQIPGGTGTAAVATQLEQARQAWGILHPLEKDLTDEHGR
jgi:argininosuccinate lyase